jgi:hypothetical protein
MQNRKFKHDVVYRCYKSFTDHTGDRARKGQRFKLRGYNNGDIMFKKASGRGTDIIFREETAHQYLCPAPTLTDGFKVGDRVKIATTSEFYKYNSNGNPRDTEGVISEIEEGYLDIYLGIYVKWDNGRYNTYNSEDLELAKQPSYIHTEEKIINHSKPKNQKVMINAIAITDVEQIKALCEAIPSIKEQVQAMYPELFEEEEQHRAGNKYIDELGEVYILATEQGAVALVDLLTGKIGKTVHVDNVNDITWDEMERVYDGKEYELA